LPDDSRMHHLAELQDKLPGTTKHQGHTSFRGSINCLQSLT
jgi:hypothetical protein